MNVPGVILGVAAASQDPCIVMASGLGATFAKSISMAAVAYTSTEARRDQYLSELQREWEEMRTVPEVKREEVSEIYKRWGLEGEALEEFVEKITSKEDTWLHVMMADELNLQPVKEGTARRSAVVVGLSAIAGSLVPLVSFFFVPEASMIFTGILVSLLISATVLFVVGAYKARTTVGRGRGEVVFRWR